MDDPETLSNGLFGQEGLSGLLDGFGDSLMESFSLDIDDIITMIGEGGLLGGLKDIFKALQSTGPLGELIGGGFLNVLELMTLLEDKEDVKNFLFGNFTGWDPTAAQKVNDLEWHQTVDGATLRERRIHNDVEKWQEMDYYDSSVINSPYDIQT
jgi:hypothetical protein